MRERIGFESSTKTEMNDGAQEPLISDDDRSSGLQYDSGDGGEANTLENSTSSSGTKSETKPGVFILLLTFASRHYE